MATIAPRTLLTADAAAPWIVDARWDGLVALSTLWFPLLVLAIWSTSASFGLAGGEVALIVYSIGFTLPHFLTTFTFTWMDPGQRAYYRARPIVFYAIPVAIIAGSWIYCAAFGPLLLVSLWLWFGEHHIAAQNLGFAALYRQRNGEDALDRRIDHLVFNSAWITTVALYVLREPGEAGLLYFARPTYTIPLAGRDGFVSLLLLVATFSFLVYLGRQVQRRRAGLPVSVPKLLFMLTTWPSFLAVPFLVADAQTAAILRGGYHAVQYLGLVYLLNERRCRERGAPSASGLLGRIVAGGPLAYLTVLATLAAGVYFVTEVVGDRAGVANDLSLRYLFFPGVALAHFFLDGHTWRFGDAHVRRTVVSYLRRDPPGLGSSRGVA